jgi:hypothetical protein
MSALPSSSSAKARARTARARIAVRRADWGLPVEISLDSVRNQGQVMVAGDGYAAATGSTHADFATDTGARYLLVFRV